MDLVDRNLDKEVKPVIEALGKCGISGEEADSSWYPSFRPNLLIVLTGPFSSFAVARAELVRAKLCGVVGYSKFSRRNTPGPGED